LRSRRTITQRRNMHAVGAILLVLALTAYATNPDNIVPEDRPPIEDAESPKELDSHETEWVRSFEAQFAHKKRDPYAWLKEKALEKETARVAHMTGDPLHPKGLNALETALFPHEHKAVQLEMDHAVAPIKDDGPSMDEMVHADEAKLNMADKDPFALTPTKKEGAPPAVRPFKPVNAVDVQKGMYNMGMKRAVTKAEQDNIHELDKRVKKEAPAPQSQHTDKGAFRTEDAELTKHTGKKQNAATSLVAEHLKAVEAKVMAHCADLDRKCALLQKKCEDHGLTRVQGECKGLQASCTEMQDRCDKDLGANRAQAQARTAASTDTTPTAVQKLAMQSIDARYAAMNANPTTPPATKPLTKAEQDFVTTVENFIQRP